MSAGPHPVELTDTIPGSVSIERLGAGEWRVAQRRFGPEHDNNQNVTWVRITNPGEALTVRVHLEWGEFTHMSQRKHAYVQRNGAYAVVTGEISPTATLFEFDAPAGESFFGAFPWYDNDRAARFLAEMRDRSELCEVRSIGKTAEGRDIECLTIGAPEQSSPKEAFVVLARIHANETPGSFAVEGAAESLLREEHAPLLDRCTFHLFPVVNPDGAAHGTKLTQMGPVREFDMVQGGMTSDDPTIKALRDELRRLRPACLISHHSYLQSFPFIGIFENDVGVRLLSELVGPGTPSTDNTWLVRFTGPEERTLRYDCFRRFNSTVVFTELPWQGRLPEQIRQQGAALVHATLATHRAKTRQAG